MRREHYPALNEWRKAMKLALAREGKPLFQTRSTISGTIVVDSPVSNAWCCAGYMGGVNRSAGPVKTRAHLRTANHFREWCIQHRDKAIERFPEVKALFAEFELTKVERTPTIVSTTSVGFSKLAGSP